MSDELRLDETAAAAARDQATVTAAGRTLATAIQDVVTVAPVNHVDHRGRVFEVYQGGQDTAFWKDPVVYCYTFTVRPLQTKGWGLHELKDDRYTLICGEVLTVMYDARVDSSTHGLIQKVHLTGEGVRQLLIPRGVWHMNINLSTQESYLINHPTQVYEHGKPDRLLLPWNSDAIPFDINTVFPNQQRAH